MHSRKLRYVISTSFAIAVAISLLAVIILAGRGDSPFASSRFILLAAVVAALPYLIFQDWWRIDATDSDMSRVFLDVLGDMPGFVWRVDWEGGIERACARIVYAAAPPQSILHPEDVPRWQAEFRQMREAGKSADLELRYRVSEGLYRWAHVRSRPIPDSRGRVTRWLCMGWDVHDRRELEHTLKTIIDTVPALIWRTTEGGEVDFLNRRCIEFHGQSVEEHASGGWRYSIHPDERDLTVQGWQHSIETHRPFDITHRFRRKDGEYRWMRVCAEPLFDQDGRVLNWYGTHTDVHEQKEAEQALRESERRMSLLLDTLPALVWRNNADGELDYINRRCTDMLGLTLEACRDYGWVQLVHPDDVEVTMQRWRLSQETHQPFEAVYRFRYTDGVYRWLKVRAAPLLDEQTGTVLTWYGVHLDIDEQVRLETELRSAQAKLSHASKVATAGELSASIAHEINQPMAAVISNGEACLRWLSATPPNLERARSTVEKIVRDGVSAAAIVQRIRALFKHAAPERVPLDLNDIIGEVLNLMRDELSRHHIALTIDLHTGLPTILADRVHVQQVLINLIQNAIDTLGSVVDRRRNLLLRTQAMLPHDVKVEVSDQGGGVVDPHKIFQPFFTTKEKGLGVGLSICRSIIEAHGGRVWAQLNEGHGTTVAFTLPVGPEWVA